MIRIYCLLCLLLGLQIKSHTQAAPAWGGLKPGPYAVGFKTIDTADYSRSYGVENPNSRPMQLNIWYPAEAGGAVMKLQDYYETWRTPAIQRIDTNFYRTNYAETMQGLGRRYPRGVAPDSVIQFVKNSLMYAAYNAVPVKGKFPLIITPGPGGDALSQGVRNEYLASHGYIVVSIPMLNESPADFNRADNSIPSILAQSNDIGFVINYFHQQPNVDINNIAVISMYLQAGLMHQFHTRKLKAIISFEDDMIGLNMSPYFDVKKITIPLLLTGSKDMNSDFHFLDSLKYAQRYILNLPGSTHLDMFQNKKIDKPAEASKETIYEMITLYFRNFLDAKLKGNQEAAAFLEKNTVARGVGEDKIKLTQLSAQEGFPTESDFLSMIRKGQVQQAQIIMERNKAVGNAPLFSRDKFSDFLLYERLYQRSDNLYIMVKMLLDAYPSAPVAERFMNIFGYQFLRNRQNDKAIEAFTLNAQHFPQSPNSWDALADAEKAAGLTEKMVEHAFKVLAFLPSARIDSRTKEQLRISAEAKLKEAGQNIESGSTEKGIKRIHINTTDLLGSLTVLNDGTLLAGTDKGYFWHSDIKAEQWVKDSSSGITTGISDIHFITISKGYAVSPGGHILTTNDASKTWEKIPYESKNVPIALHVLTPTKLFVGTANGKILMSEDAGVNWKAVYENSDHFFRDIHFINATTGYAAGGGGNANNGYGILLMTKDGGQTWAKVNINLRSTLNTITQIPTKETIVVAGYDGHMLYSENGINWRQQTHPQVRAFRKILFTTALRGYVVGDNGLLMTTTDAGQNWKTLNTGVYGSLHTMVIKEKTMIMAGENGILLQLNQ